MAYVSVFMDVEDPINDLADDAALDVAKLFTREQVRGSFCLTGEKCRTLLQRGRDDVLAAYRPHCLGLHTDTHSYHPTTMELLAEVDFDSGCQLALNVERKGFEAFSAAFNRTPAFWGGAGNTWSPEISSALKALGIPAYVYALTSLPGFAVHRFNGVFALPQALSISELDWADDARAEIRCQQVLESLQVLKSPWLGVFVGHPTKLRYSQFWDFPFNAGQAPSDPERATPLDEKVYQSSLGNLASFLKSLKDIAMIVGVDEALKFDWQFREPSSEERQFFRSETEMAIRGAARWPIHRPDLNPANIVEKTLALADTVEVATLA